jgi:hypothetical protein
MIRTLLTSATVTTSAARQFLREHFVHLTLALLLATAWVFAWCRSLSDLPRVLAPPLTREEIRQARLLYRGIHAEGPHARTDSAGDNDNDDDDEAE